MNILNVASGSLTGGVLQASPVASLAPALLSPGQSAAGGNAGSAVPVRDSVISDLPDVSSAVNLLQQAAGSQMADASQAPLLSLPPAPQMPPPQPAPAVPTDDHGQSNIVFSDADSDGTLIH